MDMSSFIGENEHGNHLLDRYTQCMDICKSNLCLKAVDCIKQIVLVMCKTPVPRTNKLLGGIGESFRNKG
jgi:hypothetical protein